MAALDKVVRALEGDGPISRDQVLEWFTDSDIEVVGAVHAYIAKSRHRRPI
jgi:hypothetical protein